MLTSRKSIEVNGEVPSLTYTAFLATISMTIRSTIGAYIFDTHLKKYPHFTTPLIEMREMKEMFYTYQQTGNFLNSPIQIGQSEYLVRLYFFVYQQWGDLGLKATLTGIDALTLILQLAVFRMIFSATEKKAQYTGLVFYWILFNPISLFAGNTHANLGGFNDMLWYLIMYLTISATRQPTGPSGSSLTYLTALNIACCYFDPRFLMLAPLVLLQYECRWEAGESQPARTFKHASGLSMQLIKIFEH